MAGTTLINSIADRLADALSPLTASLRHMTMSSTSLTPQQSR
jgi:hypothetical protein